MRCMDNDVNGGMSNQDGIIRQDPTKLLKKSNGSVCSGHIMTF